VKVIHRTDSLLVIEDRPWLLGLMMIAMALVFLVAGMGLIGSGEGLGGVFMIVIGVGLPLLIGAVMVQRVRLTFDRTSGQVTRTCRSFRGLTQQTYPLGRLDGARVDTSTDSDGSTYRMELRLKDPQETVPFTSYYTSGRKPETMAQAVTDWLRQP
jgi:hypothetical protein